MTELPPDIVKKLQQRRNQRRYRRYRKCRRTECRFDNRGRDKDWLAPSQKSKVEFKLTVIRGLSYLYPINKSVVEDVCFNHYHKRWGKYFSTVEIGKILLYETLVEWFGQLQLVSGIETAQLRATYGVTKCSDKKKHVVESHAIDALIITANELNLNNIEIPSFYVWRRYQYRRRQLHKFQFAKGGIRRREGGSNSLNGFKKGDIVLYKNRLARVGGYMNGKISLNTFDVKSKRFTQHAEPKECIRLYNQKILYTAIPPNC